MIFEFTDYRSYVLDRLEKMPARGHGELKKIAAALKTHTTRISHIFRGRSVDLTPEQACELTRYLGLSDLETEYFLALVQKERAGTPALREAIDRQLKGLRERSLQLVHRVERNRELSESDQAVFYSNWFYAGLQLACAVPGLQTVDHLARRFDLPRDQVRRIVDFLVQTGLCADESGRISMTPSLTHLEASSPLISRHHANWRMKAIQRHERLSANELAYTGPMVLAEKDQPLVRELATGFIQKVVKLVKTSEPNEKLSCLCVDWFEF